MSRLLARQLPQCCLLLLVLVAGISQAQPPSLDFGNLENGLPDFGAGDSAAEELSLSGSFRLEKGTRTGKLEVHAKAQPSWHTYSTTKGGAPSQTKLTVEDSAAFKVVGPFTPDREPHMGIFVGDQLIEEFEEVVWSAPIQITEGVDPATLTISVTFDGQVCGGPTGACMPIFTKIPAAFAGYYEPARRATEVSDNHVTITGRIEPESVQPGRTARLIVTASPAEHWHIYSHGVSAEQAGGTPTTIVLRPVPGLSFGTPQPSSPPIDEHNQLYHEGEVSWTIEIQVASNTTLSKLDLNGIIEYQVCSAKTCDQPTAASFHATLDVQKEFVEPTAGSISFSTPSAGDLGLLKPPAPAETSPKPKDDAKGTTGQPLDFWKDVFGKLKFVEVEGGWSRPDSSTVYSRGTLAVVSTITVLLMGFLGGLILNVMPCVLPVIGLKIMSFVQQSGESRKRVFVLNVWYSLGVLSIFLVFAVIAAVLHVLGQTFAWGEHLGDPRFAIPLLAVVFVLGLSMFGVWEIPIPGFVGSNKASELSQKEGPPGAFFKGALTTILATPCSGPFIGVVVGIAVIAPIWLNFALFTSMAIGMAFPFLIIGAFPKLMKWLPKPGEWMDTVKQFMGFVLMATGVWIIYFIEDRFRIPALALLIGLSISCWLVGRIPFTAERQKKVRGWLWAIAVGGCAVIMFGRMVPAPVEEADNGISAASLSRDSPELPWQKFSRDRLASFRAQKKTVFVDFTADW